MTYFIFVLPLLGLAFVLLSRFFAPKVEFAHAGHGSKQPRNIAPWYVRFLGWPTVGLYLDEQGKQLDLKNKIVGQVCGKSLLYKGVPDGAHFVAEKINEKNKRLVKEGDFVIARWGSPVNGSNLRIRVVKSISEKETIKFEESPIYQSEAPYSERTLGDICGRVTYFLN